MEISSLACFRREAIYMFRELSLKSGRMFFRDINIDDEKNEQMRKKHEKFLVWKFNIDFKRDDTVNEKVRLSEILSK